MLLPGSLLNTVYAHSCFEAIVSGRTELPLTLDAFRVYLRSRGAGEAELLQFWEWYQCYKERFDIELTEMTAILSNLRTATFGRRSRIDFSIFAPQPGGRLEDARQGQRSVYFGGTWLDTPVFGRDRLPVGATIAGPAIVAQLDTTILIDPGATAVVDAVGNLVIAVGQQPA